MNDESSRTGPPWHARPAAAVLEALGVDAKGLSRAAAAERLARHGPNRLPTPARRSALARLLAQFRNLLIYVLLGACALTLALGHWLDAGVIAAVVVINAIIGFVQEGKAEHALEAIRGLLSPEATVVRDGQRTRVPAAEVVPGDLVELEAGDRVPADLRLLYTRGLRIQEAALTGESVPVDKGTAAASPEAALGDRTGMAYASTLVGTGRGTGVVVATGGASEIGHISRMIATVSPLTTPLLRQFERFGRWLTAGILALAAATFGFGVLLRGYGAGEMFLAAVSLAVAAIPEGLPAIMTITLAIGVQRMARRNAIIRRLPAVETLGAVTLICSDKTGTLTRNEMMVQGIATSRTSYEITGAGYNPHGDFLDAGHPVEPTDDALLAELIHGALLCSDAALHEHDGTWGVTGDPTEGALVALALKAGIDTDGVARAWPRTDVIPFESEHRFMASLHHGPDGDGALYVKGAPERLLEMCPQQRGPDGADEPLDRAAWEQRIEALAARGQRVIALAARAADAQRRTLAFDDVGDGLVFIGLFGLADPPREEAIRAIARCRAAGIDVKMVTGDHVGTARAIARVVGIAGDTPVLTGPELDALDDATLAGRAEDTTVFARTSPGHKLRLVEGLQRRGHVVAMTGDGVNDAPALKRADVGVAMGLKGTDVAREAAEMVLADDNFASIANAVEEGRIVYDNLRKAITFILPTNGGEALTLIAAIALGLALPVTPVQILWINMVTAVTLALALAFEPGEAGVMRRAPRRRDDPLLSAFLLARIALVSVVMVAGTVGLFALERHAGADLATARTVAVNALVVFEVFYLLNCRMLAQSAFSRRMLVGTQPALIAIVLVLVLQAALTYTAPMQLLFDTRAIDADAWLRIVAVGVAVFLLVEGEKLLHARLRRGRGGQPGSGVRGLPGGRPDG